MNLCESMDLVITPIRGRKCSRAIWMRHFRKNYQFANINISIHAFLRPNHQRNLKKRLVSKTVILKSTMFILDTNTSDSVVR